MPYFSETSELHRSLLLTLLFLDTVLAVFRMLFLTVREVGIGKRVEAYLETAFLYVLTSLLTNSFLAVKRSRLGLWSCDLPVVLVWGLFVISTVCLSLSFFREWNAGKKRIGTDSIREAIDLLPDGIAFFDSDGSLRLCNRQMKSIHHFLTGRDLQSYGELEEGRQQVFESGRISRADKKSMIFEFEDGRVFQYGTERIRVPSGSPYTAVVCADVTMLHKKRNELLRQTVELKKLSRELADYSDNMLQLTKERELLAAKTFLHDQMGAGLTAIRQSLLSEGDRSGQEAALSAMEKAVEDLQRDTAFIARGELEEFYADARAVGITVEMDGQLPQNETLKNLCILAAREALGNAVRHGGAGKLIIRLRTEGKMLLLTMANDGKLPEGEIAFRGGLANLCYQLRKAGGDLSVEIHDMFTLKIHLPI